jgi:ribosome-binding protein aMBF1 (putative translation factor)
MEKGMSDLKKYIGARKKADKEFAEGFEEGYEQFKIGVMLRQAREAAGLTQEELALRLKTQKTAISRIEILDATEALGQGRLPDVTLENIPLAAAV